MLNKPLNLLDLPLLPMENILSYLEIDSLVNLCFVSRKSATIIQNFRPQIDPILLIFMKNRVEICFEAMGAMNCVNFACDEDEEHARFIGDVEFGVKHLIRVLGARVQGVSLDLASSPNFEQMSIWPFIGKCDHLKFDGHCAAPPDFSALFSRFQSEKSFIMHSESPNNLGAHFEVLKDLEALSIWNAAWFENHHLLEANNILIDVKNTQVTPNGANEWLKKWLAGAEQRVEVLSLNSRHEFTEEQVLDGVPKSEVFRVAHNVRSIGPFQSSFLVIDGTRELIRSDGAIARILVTQHGFHVTIRYGLIAI